MEKKNLTFMTLVQVHYITASWLILFMALLCVENQKCWGNSPTLCICYDMQNIFDDSSSPSNTFSCIQKELHTGWKEVCWKHGLDT